MTMAKSPKGIPIIISKASIINNGIPNKYIRPKPKLLTQFFSKPTTAAETVFLNNPCNTKITRNADKT